MKLNLISIILISICSLTLSACDNAVGSNGATDSTTQAVVSNTHGSRLSGSAAPAPLQITVEPHNNSTYYVPTTDTPTYSMLNVLNTTPNPVTLSTAPTLDNTTDFSIINAASSYPAGAVICSNGTTLNVQTSCLLLIKGNATGVSKISTNLTLKTPTYTYVFAVNRNPILYIGGNFSSIQTASGPTVSAYNSGKCRNNKACMLISYDPAANVITKLAETDDEIYGLAIDSNGFIITGGAFTQLSTTQGVLNIAQNNTPSTLVAQINPYTSAISTYAKANQAVYTIGASPSSTGNNAVYVSGAFNSITSGSGSATVTSSNTQCMVAQASSNNTWSKALDSADGFINSMAISASGNNDTLLLSGMFEKINGTTLSNYSTGIVSCTSGNCSNSPLALSGRANVVANSPTNQIIASGEYPSITGLSSVSHGDIELNGAGIGGWGKIDTNTADGAINAILTIGNTYYVSGNFTNISNSGKIGGSSDCGDSFNSSNLCTVVALNSSAPQTLLGANSSINSITSGMSITVVAK